MEIKNLKKAAERIKKAIKNKENIILYADADLDGTCSLLILEETIKNLGGEVKAIYFPDREEEGYGINEKALDYLKRYSPALFIALDCGISNFKEIEKAKELGFEVIIIDHHKILEKLPKADIIVDPRQKGERYPFKEFATCGIVFRLSALLLGKKLTGLLENNFIELVALATLADLMPQVKDNKFFIEKGLEVLGKTYRPALRAFLKLNEVNNPKEAIHKIISVLSAGEVKDNLTEAYLLLKEKDEKKAEKLVLELTEKNKEKHERIREIVKEVEERILKKPGKKIIFEGDKEWPLAFTGPVASKICNLYKKPTFIYKKGDKISRGAVRTPKGIDSVEAMKACSVFLITFGGHPQASGFTLSNENLINFENCLIKYFEKREKK